MLVLYPMSAEGKRNAIPYVLYLINFRFYPKMGSSFVVLFHCRNRNADFKSQTGKSKES